jgi:hypothetical protein
MATKTKAFMEHTAGRTIISTLRSIHTNNNRLCYVWIYLPYRGYSLEAVYKAFPYDF